MSIIPTRTIDIFLLITPKYLYRDYQNYILSLSNFYLFFISSLLKQDISHSLNLFRIKESIKILLALYTT